VRVYHRSSGSSKCGRVGLLGLLLLFFVVLFAQESVSRLVDSPRHVVLTPMVHVLANLFLMFFTVLWWLFLPSLILFLLTLVRCILLVFLLLALVVALLVSSVCNGAELRVQLELALEHVEGSGHCHNLLVVWGLGLAESFCLEPVKFALGGGHEGLVGDGDEFAIKVILMLMADVRFEVVAGDHKVSLKKDANGVVNGCTPGNQL
jgi:hypothetical protein